MKKISFSLLSIPLFFLVACGEDADENNGEEMENLEKLVVEIITDEEIETGETTLEAQANLQGEPLEETEHMMFEIWTGESKETSETVEGEHQGDGVYTASYQFEEDGIYHVQAHVDTGDHHVQLVKDIAVGDADLQKRETPEEASEDENES